LIKYDRSKELPIWTLARKLCQEVFKMINEPVFRKEFSLTDQIWRAAGSVMDNIKIKEC
jgi:four helix bundle protein